MRWSILLGVTSLAGCGIVCAIPTPQKQPEPSLSFSPSLGGAPNATNTTIVADGTSFATGNRRIIVEFEQGQDVDALAAQLAARPGTSVVKTFKSAIFSGASVDASCDNTDSLRAAFSFVTNTWTAKSILPPAANASLISGSSSDFVANATGVNYTIHGMTGVDKLHEAGIKGSGAKVAIVDSGVWYPHPALGGGFGPGFKVAGGYDLVGDDLLPVGEATSPPDNDPLDDLGGGTLVAGVIAADTGFWKGVVPDATLLAYKVMTQQEGTSEDTLIEAFLMAYEDGADVITSSVISPSGGSSVGAAGSNVVAVGSIDTDTVPAFSVEVTFSYEGTSNTTYTPYVEVFDMPWPTNISGLPFCALTRDPADTTSFCNSLPADTPDLSNMIPVFGMSYDCAWFEVQPLLESFGARYIMLYNQPGLDTIDEYAPVANPNEPSILAEMPYEDGAAIVEALAAGQTVTADFSKGPLPILGLPYSEGNVPSSFTSWAGLLDLTPGPEIGAPGASIFTTSINDGYAFSGGTGLAAAYVAGVAALYVSQTGGKAVHGPGFAKAFANGVASTGETVFWKATDIDGADATPFANVDRVGGGLVRADKLLGTISSTSLSFDMIGLNDTHHFSRYHQVDITNNGQEDVIYTFSLEPAGAYNARRSASCQILFPLQIESFGLVPDVDFPSGEFVVKAGQTKTAQLNFNPPASGFEEDLLPVYSGKVIINGSNGGSLGVPYFGVAANIQKQIPNMFSVPGEILHDIDLQLEEDPNVSFALDPNDIASFEFGLYWGTQEFRFDVFEPSWTEHDWTYPPVPGQAGFIESVMACPDNGRFEPGITAPSEMVAFPLHYLSRDANNLVGGTVKNFFWTGVLDNGSQITPGTYQLRPAVLTPFGNPNNGDAWSVMGHYAINVIHIEQ